MPVCLSALASQSYRDFELWLVDNGSIDGSGKLLDDLDGSLQPPWLDSPLPRPARIIRNRDNLGFAEGNNQALRLTRSEYVVLLNNDAFAETHWLGELVETAEAGGPRLGMVASTMLFNHMPDVVASAGISVHRGGLALDRGLGMPADSMVGVGTRPVFGPSGGAALYRSEMLRDVGLFDRRFFSYLEDVDLAWRARSRGWQALHNPRARVRHEYSATGGHDSSFKRRLISRNRLWTIYKNAPEATLREGLAPLLLYEMLALLRAIFYRDRPQIAGRIEALKALHLFTEDRRKITTSARLHPSEMERLYAPPLTPRQIVKYRKRLSRLLSSRA